MNAVGVDIGGTFTDLVGVIDGKIVTSKSSTVPADPTQGVADTLDLVSCDMTRLAEVLPRLDHRNQHGARAERGARRVDHDQRLS